MQAQKAKPYKYNTGWCGVPVILVLLFILNAIFGRSIQTKSPDEHQPTQYVLPTYFALSTYMPKIPVILTQTAVAHLMQIFNDGSYLINKEIAAGTWRNDGAATDCYWAVTTRSGEIVSNYFGVSGGTAFIPAMGFQFQTQDCGNWTFLGH